MQTSEEMCFAQLNGDYRERACTPPPEAHLAASGDTIMKTDVEKMIRDWQAECADHPALYNQANVLLDRLKALKPSLGMNDFLTAMDAIATMEAKS